MDTTADQSTSGPKTSAQPNTSFRGLITAELDRHLRRRSTWIALPVAFLLGCAVLLDGTSDLEDAIPSFAIFMMIWAFFAAASNVGHDISSGALGTWFSFHPDRTKVWVARLVAIVGTTAVVSAILMWVPWVLWNPDYPAATDMPLMVQLTLTAIVMIMVCALFGAALAAIFGSTLAALGSAAGYLALFLVSMIIMGYSNNGWGPLLHIVELLTVNTYHQACADGPCPYSPEPVWEGSIGHVLGLSIWLAITLGIATFRWQRRDVD